MRGTTLVGGAGAGAGAGTNIRPAITTCFRPTEAARFREQKCANNHQLIVAGVQRFLRHACAAHFRVIHTRRLQATKLEDLKRIKKKILVKLSHIGTGKGNTRL